MKWAVRKGRSGDWWAHQPGCRQLGYLICVLFNGCQNCGRFEAAIGWAQFMASNRTFGAISEDRRAASDAAA